MIDPNKLPQKNELFYTMKLKNGDEILFTMVNEDELGLVIESPIKVSVFTYMDDGVLDSNLVTQKWVIFSEEQSYFIPIDEILYYGPMAEVAYKIYMNAVNRYLGKETEEISDKQFFVDPIDTLQ